LFQDTTGLRSRKGDTGIYQCSLSSYDIRLTPESSRSVLWRARYCYSMNAQFPNPNLHFHILSVHLGRLLLSQPSPSDTPLLSTTSLSSCHVLELGFVFNSFILYGCYQLLDRSGTGLLGIILAPLVAKYTATDLPQLLPLIRKNMEFNLSPSERSKTFINDIDWVQLHNTPTQLRHKIFPPRSLSDRYFPRNLFQERSTARRTAPPVQLSPPKHRGQIDLIIAVDCIYNPSLTAPLLDTVEYLTTLDSRITAQSQTEVNMNVGPLPSPTVLIVLELRAAEASRDFLHAWLELPGRWEIWSVLC